MNSVENQHIQQFTYLAYLANSTKHTFRYLLSRMFQPRPPSKSMSPCSPEVLHLSSNPILLG